jgi:hypothetical protein
MDFPKKLPKIKTPRMVNRKILENAKRVEETKQNLLSDIVTFSDRISLILAELAERKEK